VKDAVNRCASEEGSSVADSRKTYSIMFRLRRVTAEDAYVAVPVTAELMNPEPTADGTFRLNTDSLWAEALRIGEDPRVEWRTESIATEPHPVQGPKPEDRKSLDPYYDQFPTN
jgi:hypothetical protein